MAEIDTNIPNLEITKKAAPPKEVEKKLDLTPPPVKPQGSVFDNLQLMPPMVMPIMDKDSKTTLVSKMTMLDAGAHLPGGVTAGAYVNGMNGLMIVKPTSQNDSIYMPSSMGSAGAQSAVKIIPGLKLYALEGVDYMTDYKEQYNKQNSSILGVAIDKNTKTETAGIRTTASISAMAFKGKSLERKDGAFGMTPIDGWTISGTLKEEFDGGTAVIAQIGASDYKKAENHTRAYTGSLSLETPSVTVSANGSITDFTSPEKCTHSKQAGINLATPSRKNVNLFAMADSDNTPEQFKSKSVRLMYQEGRASVGVDARFTSSVDPITNETIKNKSFGFNAGYVW